MKNKKIIPIVCACALTIPLALGLTACGKPKTLDINAKDVYATAAVSSANYLKEIDETSKVDFSSPTSLSLLASTYANTEVATARPESLSDSNIQGMKSCLTMFDSVIANGGINQETEKNPNTDPNFANYTFAMNITIPGTSEKFVMYYNETNTETKEEVDDEEVELEVSTDLEGVMVIGETEYDLTGKREFEQEGNETEATISFTTKSKKNALNYVEITQSVENNEIEYEYKIFKDGVKIQETEIEIENDNNSYELEFQFKVNGIPEETVYKIVKGEVEGSFVITYMVGKEEKTINVEKTLSGYTFTYDNGFVENI